MRANIQIYNEDCMPALEKMADNAYDLAICDPPYGIGDWTTNQAVYKDKHGNKRVEKSNKFKKVNWNDRTPPDGYFNQVNRISKNQIIWGANYYNCFSSLGGCVIWYKGKGNPVFSACELASLSFQKRVDYVFINWQSGFSRQQKENVIHPCQKPVQLYKWLLQNYAKEGDKILDTHLGSGSIAIACWDLCFNLTAYEIDKDYYNGAVNRLERHKSQGQLF